MPSIQSVKSATAPESPANADQVGKAVDPPIQSRSFWKAAVAAVCIAIPTGTSAASNELGRHNGPLTPAGAKPEQPKAAESPAEAVKAELNALKERFEALVSNGTIKDKKAAAEFLSDIEHSTRVNQPTTAPSSMQDRLHGQFAEQLKALSNKLAGPKEAIDIDTFSASFRAAVGEVRTEMTIYEISQLGPDWKATSTGKSGIRISNKNFEVDATINSYGTLSNVHTQKGEQGLKCNRPITIAEVPHLLRNAQSAWQLLGTLDKPISKGTLIAKSCDTFEIDSPEGPLKWVPPGDILKASDDKAEMERKSAEKAKLETRHKELDKSISEFEKKHDLEKICKAAGLPPGADATDRARALKRTDLPKDVRETLAAYHALKDERSTNARAQEALEQSLKLKTHDVVAGERKGSVATKSSSTTTYTDKKSGKEIAQYGMTGIMRNDGAYAVCALSQTNLDGSRVYAEYAAGIGAVIKQIVVSKDGTPVSGTYFREPDCRLVEKRADFGKKTLTSYDAKGNVFTVARFETFSSRVLRDGSIIANLQNIESKILLNRKGESISTFDHEKAANPKLTPEGYVEKVAKWSGGDPDLIMSFFEEFYTYVYDTNDRSQPHKKGTAEDHGDNWQLPTETVTRLERIDPSRKNSLKNFLGDCEDLAFASREFQRLANPESNAMVISVPSHAICLCLEKKDGKYFATTTGTCGVDHNGRVEDVKLNGPRQDAAFSTPGSEEKYAAPDGAKGFSTAEEAINAVLRKYESHSLLGVAKAMRLTVDVPFGLTACEIPKKGEKIHFQIPLEALTNSELRKAVEHAAILRFVGKLEEATKAYRELCEKLPNSSGLKFDLALTLFSAGKYKDARTELASAEKLSPNSREIQSLAAAVEYGLGNREAAASKIASATKFESGMIYLVDRFIDPLLNKGEVDGNKGVARDFLMKELKERLDPRQLPLYEGVLNRLGRVSEIIALREREVEQARTNYQKSLKENGADKVPEDISQKYLNALKMLAYRCRGFDKNEKLEAVQKEIGNIFGEKEKIPAK